MKRAYRWIIPGVLGCLLIAALGYFWATGLMSSLNDFRSPLAENPPAPGMALGQPLSERVVLVLIDGLRYDTSLDLQVMPYLDQLRQTGASAAMHSRPPSFSAPAYSVLMTGAWPDLSDGPAMNPEEGLPRTWTQDNIFSSVHRAGMKTAVSAYVWFQGLIPQATVDASFYTAGDDRQADRDVVDAAIPMLESGDYQYILIHLDQVDYAGHHEGGPQHPNWQAAASRADGLVLEIASHMNLQQDTIIIVSDHGQIDAGGHGGQDPIVLVEPFVLAGAGVKPGHYSDMQMVDVAPTIATLLGANLPATGQGKPLVDMLEMSAEQAALLTQAFAGQQNALAQSYLASLGLSDEIKSGAVSSSQQLMQAAKVARLNRERLPRFGLALVLTLIPAGVLFRKGGQLIAVLLGSALAYILLFNLRYAILDGRTYSLSSVAGADEIILYTAVTTLVAFGLVWLGTMTGLRSFKKVPREAAETSLGLSFVTLYLVLLPALWSFALNGALITWTLPDFGSMFLGFLSILQALILAAAGLLFSALAAWVAKLTSNPKTVHDTLRGGEKSAL
jgi:hypothetical protein